jgi:hypothetical protein
LVARHKNGKCKPQTAASLSAILLAVAAGLGSKAHAQTNATDKHRWLEDCPVNRIYSTHNTGSNFSVKVSFHKDPTSSVPVLLARQPDERDWPVVATSETDSRGTAGSSPSRLGNIKLASWGTPHSG